MKVHAYSSKHYITEPIGGNSMKLTYDDGYESTVPNSVFNRDFRQNGRLSFGDALVALESGKRVSRSGWNGKGMWLVLIPKEEWGVQRLAEPLGYSDWIGMRTADHLFVPWLASQTDVLAKDWCVLDQD